MKRRFWYDTEFIERPSTIDLISIGIVDEEGREFYGVNEDCNFEKANPWVKENVLPRLPWFRTKAADDYAKRDLKVWFHANELAKAVLSFLTPSKENPVELWGYYSAYDHVAMCWLFGPMVDLPKGMPMYTKDIKQLCDSLGNPKLPEQGKSEHDALADAGWNKKAWEFLMGLMCPECGSRDYVGADSKCCMCGYTPNAPA